LDFLSIDDGLVASEDDGNEGDDDDDAGINVVLLPEENSNREQLKDVKRVEYFIGQQPEDVLARHHHFALPEPQTHQLSRLLI
jgi:hypothetical protein